METKTENGENAFSTTSDYNLDFFVSLVRSVETNRLIDLLESSWVHNPELTLKMILYARDCRNGGGEKFLSLRMMIWLMCRYEKIYSLNLREFVNMGKLHDLLRLIRVKQFLKLPFGEEIAYFIELLKAGKHNAFKWAPSEGKEFNDIAKIFRHHLNMSAKEYRQFLTAGRKKELLIENILCQKIEGDVDFSKIPSQAMFKYKKSLLKSTHPLHEQYRSYLDKVEKGEAKINTGTLMPYQMINQTDETSNILWNDLIKNLAGNEELKNSIAVCDVSGSMGSFVGGEIKAMDVAISLSLVIAELSSHRQIITFSESPTLLNIPENTRLADKVKYIRNAPWGMNTNILATFKLIFEKNIDVKYIFIFTDMQFDFAVSKSNEFETSYDKCAKIFEEAGRKIPQIIYWNVSSAQTALPVQKGKCGTSLISGFSSALFKSILDGDDISPLAMMKKILNPYKITYQDGIERKPGIIPWDDIEPKIKAKPKITVKAEDVRIDYDSLW